MIPVEFIGYTQVKVFNIRNAPEELFLTVYISVFEKKMYSQEMWIQEDPFKSTFRGHVLGRSKRNR